MSRVIAARTPIKIFFAVCVVAAAFSSTACLTACNGVFYQPDHVQYIHISQIPKRERPQDIRIPTADGQTLDAWHFAPRVKFKSRNDTVVLHFHGNAQNLSSHFLQLFWLPDQGFNYIIVDYRGYGKSDGRASRQHVYEDVKSAIRYAQEHYKNVILYGQSLGGAALLGGLLDLKDKSHIKGVVIEASFASYQRIARRKLAHFWVSWPFQWLGDVLVTDSHAPIGRIHQLSPIPILVVHGRGDQVVEFIEGQEIYGEAAKQKRFIAVDRANHLQCLSHADVRRRIVEQFDQWLKPNSTANLAHAQQAHAQQ